MRRRRLAAELHRLRAAAHLTLEEVADELECSPAKISRIENGQVAVRIQDARELLDLYEVSEGQRDLLLQMVRQARGKGWWSHYADVLDESGQTLLSLEDEASSILVYETNYVTPLLQSRRYAWELVSSRTDAPLDQVERLVDLRMDRQQTLDRANAPALTVVLDEAALRRTVSTGDVMREQCERLIDAAERPGINLRVLLFGAGAHQAMGFPFQIFEFVDDDPHLVYVELLSRGQVLESAEEIGRYRAAFNQVYEHALSPGESQNFLGELAKEHG
jgi:transcriptional regulator with XRE-family HTH domain